MSKAKAEDRKSRLFMPLFPRMRELEGPADVAVSRTMRDGRRGFDQNGGVLRDLNTDAGPGHSGVPHDTAMLGLVVDGDLPLRSLHDHVVMIDRDPEVGNAVSGGDR